MATRKQLLLERLAVAREKKAEKRFATKRITTPKVPEPEKPPQMGVITNPNRQLAKTCTDSAMIMGWDKAVQKTAYENGISEDRMRQILDEALDYEDKADPSGRIEGLQDWMHERKGRSELSVRALR